MTDSISTQYENTLLAKFLVGKTKKMNKNNTPLFVKIIVSIIPIFLIIGGFVYMSLRASRLSREFYTMEIASLVVKTSDWQKRSIDFYLANGVELNFLSPADGKMAIGDSVSKTKDTFIYSVYRKNSNNEYVLLTTYDYRKVN